jgi:hypothetical protein
MEKLRDTMEANVPSPFHALVPAEGCAEVQKTHYEGRGIEVGRFPRPGG